MPPSKSTIVLIGTCDTKWDEMIFTQEQILHYGSCSVLLMDVGRIPSTHETIAIKHPNLTPPRGSHPVVDMSRLPRAEYIKEMIIQGTRILTNLYQGKEIHGVISIGGSCGTGLATAIMQKALPVGFPKLMVSTMASGDVKPYVEETDITMMYSVVDIAGTNWILNRILSNAAAAINGMAASFFAVSQEEKERGQDGATHEPITRKKRIGVTMFGVTTPCVNRIRERLEQAHGCEVYVFHATGAGGKAMERLIREKQLDAVADITTTEIADELVGGVLTAGADRLIAAAEAGIPQVISVGACDMVNFGPRDTVPSQFLGRLLYEHNPSVTLMRTTADDCRQIAHFIAQKLRAHASRPDLIRVVLPTAGISMLDIPGQPFHHPEADSILFSTLEKELEGSRVSVLRDSRQINDPDFATSVAESLASLMKND